MSNAKQWVPNKVSAGNYKPRTYPFDGSIVSKSTSQAAFRFSVPGLINGAFPENMWGKDGDLISLDIPSGDSKWFLVCECRFSNTSFTSATLKILNKEPPIPQPSGPNQVPNSATIIMWAGIGKRKAWKVCKGNIMVKPVLVTTNYKFEVRCGELGFESYYVMLGYS